MPNSRLPPSAALKHRRQTSLAPRPKHRERNLQRSQCEWVPTRECSEELMAFLQSRPMGGDGISVLLRSKRTQWLRPNRRPAQHQVHESPICPYLPQINMPCSTGKQFWHRRTNHLMKHADLSGRVHNLLSGGWPRRGLPSGRERRSCCKLVFSLPGWTDRSTHCVQDSVDVLEAEHR